MNRLVVRNLLILGLSILCFALFLTNFLKDREPVRILVYQDKPQAWADALKLGFDAALRGDPAGRSAAIVMKSAASDPEAATGLSRTIAREKYALIFALGTQASQDVFQAVKNIPVLFGAVTDPVAAGFYTRTVENPRGNVTGTQDLWPYPAQFDLMVRLVPHLKTLGIVYNSSEVNSQVSVGLINQECQRRGINLLQRTVTEPSQLSLAVSGLIQNRIDAFFIPADNTAQSNAQPIIADCIRARIPVFTGISGIVQNGALGTVGTNYVELGRVNARQALQILKGTEARKIPVATAEKGDLYLNESTADKLGITIPEDLRKRALEIYR